MAMCNWCGDEYEVESLWQTDHKCINAEEREYTCKDCNLIYTLSAERIETEAPKHDSFICDICEDK